VLNTTNNVNEAFIPLNATMAGFFEFQFRIQTSNKAGQGPNAATDLSFKFAKPSAPELEAGKLSLTYINMTWEPYT
jgi:hypothetical protein